MTKAALILVCLLVQPVSGESQESGKHAAKAAAKVGRKIADQQGKTRPLIVVDPKAAEELLELEKRIKETREKLRKLLEETYDFRVTKGFTPYLPRQYGKSHREPGARVNSSDEIYDRMMDDLLQPGGSVWSASTETHEINLQFPSLKHGTKKGLAWLHPTKGGHHVRVRKIRQFRMTDIDRTNLKTINKLAKEIRDLQEDQ